MEIGFRQGQLHLRFTPACISPEDASRITEELLQSLQLIRTEDSLPLLYRLKIRLEEELRIQMGDAIGRLSEMVKEGFQQSWRQE
ncbi:MAG: hypothetical protein QW328_07750 [Nitrososphaerota archaeon]